MQLPRTLAAASRLEWLERAGSTNDVLVGRAGSEGESAWPSLSVVATDEQTSGRGRLGRTWTAPAGSALAASVLVRPAIPVEAFGWLPLVAGLAMTGALEEAGARAELKWPNDVLIGGRKVCGILSELLPDLSGAVIGSGVNMGMTAEQLPVPTATSLAVEGVEASVDTVLGGYLERLRDELDALSATGGDAETSGTRLRVERACGTVGRAVRVLLPDGSEQVGEATGIDASGRLVVDRGAAGPPLVVAAGDVTHLRY
ncbi:biotin--[acetyl-CoA-carboxylase] ligase [Herbiconiux sp. L3-i23]|uniref:biotin--[acetyl-CoA-carboxylase] ligase n=1 Tax=Herbiconiux sp. L3-i23 TaxID=2905871 RepID=UPI002074490B|nr:biotin--[acetyl-CoA-carboxylase] ligase [Herbiconiux sp. L3-i23]